MKFAKHWLSIPTVLTFAAAFIVSGVAWSQVNLGAIKGEVQDTQQAAIPGATLTLKNESTGIIQSANSGAAGQYAFLNLAAGNYTLTTAAHGFSTNIQQHVVVGTGSTVALPIVLQPGQVQQTVTVAANAAQVETQTSELGTVISPQEMKDLPVSLNSDMRNPLNFVVLTPGVAGSQPGATPDYRLHFSGSVSYANEIYIDGIPLMNTNLLGDSGGDHPPLDAISQFKVITSNQTAKYGLSSGIVSFAFKSGTNQFHGSAFDYLQNDALNAAGFVTNALGLKKAPLKQNEFGGTIGGPVWIPKLYDGHNKTFFFVEWTGFAYRPSSNNATLTTIPNAFRQGDFSQLLGPQLKDSNGAAIYDAEGRPIYTGEIYNPYSEHTVIGPNGQTYSVLDPFGDPSNGTLNIIPSGSPALSAVSQTVLQSFPTATNNALQNNFVRLQSSKIDEHRLVVKIDHHFSEKQSISGSFFSGGFKSSNNGGLNLLDATQNSQPTLQIRLSHNYAFSATLLNNLNIGYIRDTGLNGALVAGPDFSGLGIQGALPPLGPKAGYPGIGIPEQNGIGGVSTSFDQENRYIINDNLTMIRGNHTLSFGGEARDLQRNEGGEGSGAFNFAFSESALGGTGFVNGSQTVTIPGNTGSPAASFLFGNVDFVNFGFPIEQAYRWKQFGLYAQDDWKATPKLTLNLGIRYDLQIPRSDAKGQVSTMNPTLPNPSAGGIPGAYEFFGKGPGRNGRNRLGNIDYLGFQPRFGFAYSPFADDHTAFRGGFAVVRPIGNDNIESAISGGQYSAGFSGLAQFSRGQSGALTSGYLWDTPYPSSNVAFNSIDPGLLVGNDNPAMIHPSSGEPPFQMYWTTQVQQQVNRSMIFTVGYVGMHTYHLGTWSKPNQINPAAAQAKYGAAAAADGLSMPEFLTMNINDPRAAAAGVLPPWPGFSSIFAPGDTVGQALRPWPQYGDVDNPLNPIGSVSYNGLQASLQKRFSQGLTFLLSYTFSKTIGDVDSNSGPSAGAENAIFAGSFFQDYYDSKSERAVTSSDIPHDVALSYTYELPIGKGKPFLNRGGISDEVFGGWSVSGIQRYMSGRPIHIEYDAVGAANPYFAAGDGYSFRPNVVPNQPLKNPGYRKNCSGPLGSGTCSYYINPGAFTSPAVGTFGNAPNLFSSLRMPSYLNEDLSVSKRTKITERADLQFQANFFNALNRTIFSNGGNAVTFIQNFAPPNLAAAANSGSIFGQMTAQQNSPRIIQFGMKLEF
ncbi:MAG: carboxypeptidase regulatory-like domain-containing protein [Acidobacteriaceae bacterium]